MNETPIFTEPLSLLVLREKVLFPSVPVTINITRPAAKNLIGDAHSAGKLIAVVCQKDRKIQFPIEEDIYRVGVIAEIKRVMTMPDKTQMVVLVAHERMIVKNILSESPYMTADVEALPESGIDYRDHELLSILQAMRETLHSIIMRSENVPDGLLHALDAMSEPELVINFCCSTIQTDIAEMQQLLELDDIKERGARMQQLLSNFDGYQQTQNDIKKKTAETLNQNQREYYLQQQMRAIQKELGDTSAQEVEDLRKRGLQKNWDTNVAERFNEEVKKLERLSGHSPEYSSQLNYIEVMLSLPWNDVSEDNDDLRHAERVLNRDHYGIEQVKERILEYLAAKMHGGMILCLYGPPGVGKTSLGKSIATALGRKYVRVSLGGLHDEAEIRGHRRTYIGSMPGRIIDSLRKVGTSNPVFVLDEIDKVYADYHGDPTSALLEVLDPEQNKAFHDNFLDVDYDLSKILFIATANTLQSIPRPLLDRMELIEMTGYLQEEKEQIAKHYLVPKQLEEYCLKSSELKFSAKSIRTLIDDYTRESGVRELERKIGAVIRKIVKKRALGEDYPTNLQPDDIHTLLGKPRFSRDRYEGNEYPGVVTGLAWTQVGGEILFIETSLAPSRQSALTLTGNLGDVMKESATIALSYVRAHAADFHLKTTDFDKRSVHVHVPEGAIPKDGPSAGITMTTAIVSAFTGRRVRERLAMTGEMTLRGRVLPVGGIKEKILAAKRAGIKDIILCKENEKDILEIPDRYLKGLTFHYVSDIHEVIDFALI